MERMSPFALRRPASLAEAVAMLAADRHPLARLEA